MKFLSIQHASDKNTWALTLFFLWICSCGVIINNTGMRTDIFLTLGILPFSFSMSFGLSHNTA